MPSISGRYGVTRLFDGKLPAGFDFRKLEESFPLDDSPPGNGVDPDEERPYAEIRRKLFWKWGETDPAGAANLVMAHPDRLNAKLIESVVGGYASKNPSRAGIAEWIAQFPEGPDYDVATQGAVIYIRESIPNETREMALKIRDPKMREKASSICKLRRITPNSHPASNWVSRPTSCTS